MKNKKVKREVVYFILANDGSYDFKESERGKAISLYDDYKKCNESVTMVWTYRGGGYMNLLMNYKKQ